MLGLADRGRVLDLFEKLMGGKIAEALADLSGLYDAGADPLAVMQDLLETTHFLTRVKVAPAAQGFFDGGSGEAKRAAELAAKLSVPSLTRAWQMLLKGLFEVRDATRPISACEMALIRLAYAAELPPTDKLVKDLLDGGAGAARRVVSASRAGGGTRAHRAPVAQRRRAMRAPSPHAGRRARPRPSAAWKTLSRWRAAQRARSCAWIWRTMSIWCSWSRAGSNSAPSPRAPRTLAGDLQQKLRDWTGERWTVSIASEGGAPTLAEQKTVRQDRALRKRGAGADGARRAGPFPRRGNRGGARRRCAEDIAPAMPEAIPTVLMAAIGSEIERLIQLLAKLPGLGPRSARRAALALLKKRDTLAGAAGRQRCAKRPPPS